MSKGKLVMGLVVVAIALVAGAFPHSLNVSHVVVDLPPSGTIQYSWVIGGVATNQSVTVSNQNDVPVTLTLGAWTNELTGLVSSRVTWVSGLTAVVQGHGTTNLTADVDNTSSTHGATNVVAWTNFGGSGGRIYGLAGVEAE